MKNFFIALVVFAVWTFFALWLYSFIKSAQIADLPEIDLPKIDTKELAEVSEDSLKLGTDISLEEANNQENIQEETIKTGLIGATKQGEMVFYFEQGLKIKKNDSTVFTSEENIGYPYKVLNYLVQHSDKEVIIQSKYSANEGINNPNYGMVRGEFVKEQLVDVGIEREKIVVRSQIDELEFDSGQTYNNGIKFVFDTLNLKRIEELKAALPDNRIVYPGFSGSGIVANQELKDLAAELKELFIKRPETTIKVIGHTDNIGNFQDNYATGLKYARQVRWYLVSKAQINRNLVTAVSKGEAEPIDTNRNERGRNKNRRIEIVFN